MNPCDAKTDADIMKLSSDNLDAGDFYLSLSKNTIRLVEWPNGKSKVAEIRIPRKIFDRFVKWYQTGETK